jgi:hypothetical protein
VHIKIKKMNSTENANAESHYLLIVFAIVVGLAGVYLRFADFHYANIIANILLIIGVGIALKAVFAILK